MSAWILENYNCYRFVAFDIDDCKGMREEYMLLYFSTHAKTSESLRMLATLLYHRKFSASLQPPTPEDSVCTCADASFWC